MNLEYFDYFKHSGNLKKVSEEMFTHYNTIIYRIQRIKEITGVDFDDYDEILNLQIALKIHEFMKL
ncbi:MAG: transcriptional regulator, CdaR [Anaerocolumna sp.]|nr:transcriptional regulator, CdaR [Anaerocolumna sp.]